MKIVTPVFLIGCIAIVLAFSQYPLVDIVTTAALFAAGFIFIALLLHAGRNENVSARYVLAAVLPWVIAGLLFANGALDNSEETRHPTTVVETSYASSYRSIGMRHSMVVQSWRPGRTTETVHVSAFQPFFHPGERITIGVKIGALGISWISSISR